MTRIVMMGTHFETRGGIASVVKAYREHGLLERWPVDYIATHRDGSVVVKAAYAFTAFLRLLVRLFRYRDAALHVHSASHASFWRKAVFMTMARAAGWKIVFHLHGGGFAHFVEQECGPVRRALALHVLRHADVIVVLSARWREWIHRVTDHPRIEVIPHPVALTRPQSLPAGATMAFCGRCGIAKGIDVLLDALRTLRETHPQATLECAGDGDLAEVAAKAKSIGVADAVRLHGWVSNDARESLVARNRFFVLPSRVEGLPMSLLEAMAAGRIVVASSVGGIPDVIEHGVNGWLVPPGDSTALANALRRLIDDPELASRIGVAARATIAARFAPARALEPLDGLYPRLGIAPRLKDCRGRLTADEPAAQETP